MRYFLCSLFYALLFMCSFDALFSMRSLLCTLYYAVLFMCSLECTLFHALFTICALIYALFLMCSFQCALFYAPFSMRSFLYALCNALFFYSCALFSMHWIISEWIYTIKRASFYYRIKYRKCVPYESCLAMPYYYSYDDLILIVFTLLFFHSYIYFTLVAKGQNTGNITINIDT